MPRRSYRFKKAMPAIMTAGAAYAGYKATRYIARKALTTAKKLKGIINSEKKFFETAQGGAQPTDTGIVIPISNVLVGDTNTTRNGKSILCKGVGFRMRLLRNVNGSDSQTIRAMIVRDTMFTGSNPDYGNIVQNVGTSLAPLQYNDYKTNQGRYQTLYTKLFTLDKGGTESRVAKLFKKTNFHILYQGDGEESTDGWKNQLFLVFATDAASNQPFVDYVCRIWFYDN